ncbi:hypothetical protein FRC19_005128 [Serendipita sp. 401]|nr:hypothetical protein FRC19_005128 [Serendipita sp. 401]KAG9030637.1 hypothetical protein FS842_004354 [Serendipita sp. 407]
MDAQYAYTFDDRVYPGGYTYGQGHFQAPDIAIDPLPSPNVAQNRPQMVYHPRPILVNQSNDVWPPTIRGHPSFDRVGPGGTMVRTSPNNSNHVHQTPQFLQDNQHTWQDQLGFVNTGGGGSHVDDAVGQYAMNPPPAPFVEPLMPFYSSEVAIPNYYDVPPHLLSPNSSGTGTDYSATSPNFPDTAITPPHSINISPVSPYVRHSLGSTIDLPPTRVVCPASDDEGRCSCEAEPDEILIENTPYMPHNGPKPRRAVTGKGTKHKGACRREVVAHFPPDRNLRQLALDFLANPGNANLLKLLVKPNKRCYGCPNASFSSMTKAQDHILGQFKIKNHICNYCGKRSIRKDDHKNHHRTCPKIAQRHNDEKVGNSLERFHEPPALKHDSP